MPDFTIAIAMLQKPIEDMFTAATGTIKDTISHLKADRKVAELHNKLWKTQRVKTIWQTERPISLNSFFYPVNITSDENDNSLTTRLNTIGDLPHRHNIIFGTVGQGKSILMRYLLGKEIKTGASIPVFCELRNLETTNLENYLSERFSLLLDIGHDDKLFDFFANRGKIAFFLDGFDEIDPAKVHVIMQQIEDFATKYVNCRILLSSRPDSECKHLTSFHTIRIAPLSNGDLAPFYKKITKDQEFTDRLMGAIKKSPLQTQELIQTPLLATLLAISYRAAHKIPLDFAEFYEELFQVLLVRHDNAKLGWRRVRKTKLSDREIQQVFEAFCFATKKNKLLSLKKDDAYNAAASSLANCQLTADPGLLLEDIKKVTCLLTEEGKIIDFVHASVQEFFASKYIKSRPEPVAMKIYTLMLDGKWLEWQQSLLFLQQIDLHRANKYFFIPDIDRTLKFYLQGAISATADTAYQYLSEQRVIKTRRDGIDSYTLNRSRDISTYHLINILDSRTFSFLFSPRVHTKSWHYGFMKNPECTSRTFLEISRDREGNIETELINIVNSIVNSLIRDRDRLAKTVELEAISTTFTDI